MNIAILGLGAVGSVIVRLCQKDKQIRKIICLVRNKKKAKIFLTDGLKKVVLKEIDALKEKNRFIREISKADLVVNAASSRINLEVLEAAWKANVNYLDLASHHLRSPSSIEQFEFDGKFKRKGLKGLICTGIAPGISNLLIRKLAGGFDSIDNVKIRLAENTISQDIVSSWSPDLAIEELSDTVSVLKNGRFILKKPFSDEEVYNYPLPFGKMPATLIAQDEQITIPRFIKVRNMEAKSGGNDVELMKLFYRLGLFSEKPMTLKGTKIKPKDLLIKIIPPTPSPQEMINMLKKGRIQEARFGVVVEIHGKKNGHTKKIKSWLISPSIFKINQLMPGATYISYPAGLAAYLFIRNFKKFEFKGIISPEALGVREASRILKDFKKLGQFQSGQAPIK